MKKTIWIINQYASTTETGMGGRHFYFAQELSKLGNEVYVIAASANHLLSKKPKLTGRFTFKKVSGFNFVWVKMPDYSQAHSKQRAINWFLFSWHIRKLARIIPDKPDVIICSSPSPVAFLGAEQLARKLKSKLVFEVRDIWPLSLIEIGGYSASHPFMRFMQWIENRAYRKSDLVFSNLKNSIEHMAQHGLDRNKFTWIPNGFSMEEVNQNKPLNKKALDQLPKDKFIIGYAGTLGVANTLDTFINAAELLKEKTDIAFVIVGHGKEKTALQQLANAKQLSNVVFVDQIPKIEIQSLLSKFDTCYIGWLKGNLYKFGIGANKIPEYLYSGKPILHSYSGACDPVTEYRAGICIEAQNSKMLADAIIKLQSMPESERNKLGENGKKAAIEQYEYGILAKKLEQKLFA